MTEEKVRQQARFLLNFGRKMRDHLLRVHMNVCSGATAGLHEEISPAQVHMLIKIRQVGDCTISELAAQLDVSAPSVSAMVDRLVEKGALIRERSTSDRRVVAVRLSAEADKHVELMEAGIEERFITIIEKVGPELTEQWCEVIDKIGEALQEEP